MLKLKANALRDDVAAGRRRLHIKAVCIQSIVTTASSMDNASLPPTQQTPLNRIISPLRERLITMQKQLEGTQKYINERCSTGCPYRWATRAIIVSNTHAPQRSINA